MYFRRSGVEWVLFVVPFAVVAGITLAAIFRDNAAREAPDRFLATVRFLIHAYFLWLLVSTGIAEQLPILLYVSVAMVAVETAIVSYVSRAFRRRAIALAS
jgi:hypothetical protein